MVRERKGRERKYTGGGRGGRKLEEYGRKGEGIISTQGGQVLSHVSCAWLRSENFDIA